MPFDGSGNFTREHNWTEDLNNDIDVRADRMDEECDNFANGFENCLTRDGQGQPSADIDWNNKKITNLADPTTAKGVLNIQTAQAGAYRFFTSTGSANAYVGSLVPSVSSLFSNMSIFMKANHTNTGPSTLNLTGLSKNIYIDALPLIGGEILQDGVYELVYNATADRWQLIIHNLSNFRYLLTTGSANAYVGSAPLTLLNGTSVLIKANHTNTGASTFNFNSTGAKNIYMNSSALTGGEIVSGDFYQLIYNLSDDRWQLLIPYGPLLKLYSTEITGVPQTSITIPSLDGNRDIEYELHGFIYGGQASGDIEVQVRLNNDSGNNYQDQRHVGTANSSVAVSNTNTNHEKVCYDIGNGKHGKFIYRLHAKSGRERISISEFIGFGNTAPVVGHAGHRWYNTADNITSIVVFATTTNGLGVGSHFKLYAVK